MGREAVMRDRPDMLEIKSIPGRRNVPREPIRDVEPLAEKPGGDAGTIPEHDEVDACSVASFPASDPPSWWGGR
jgi:hypothetical protein